MVDYYELLEISRNASKEVIEKAYKALIKKYHPDVAPADKKSEYEEKLKKINLAYETIIDENKRKDYDARLKAEEYQSAQQSQNYQSAQQSQNYQSAQQSQNYQSAQASANPQNTERVVETRTVYQTDENALRNEQIRHQEEMENMRHAYDQYIDNLARSMYGEGNYYYVDNRTFKEKVIDFKNNFIRKLKITVVFIIVMAVSIGILCLNEDMRTEIMTVFGYITGFFGKIIEIIKKM